MCLNFLNRFKFFIILVVIVLISSCILYNHLEKTSFHGDESGWISSSNYYTDLLFALDFNRAKWDDEKCSGWLRGYNLHAAQYLIGIPLKIRSLYNKKAGMFFSFYNFDISLRDNIKMGHVPQLDILLFARKISIFFGVLCCMLIFGTGYYAQNASIGVIAALLLMTNKLFIISSTRAMTDIYYNFFLLCFTLLLVLSIRFPQKISFRSLSIFGGILIGIATSVKITGIIIGGSLFYLVYLLWGHIERQGPNKVFKRAFLFLFFSFITIYLLNPNFWPSTLTSLDFLRPLRLFGLFKNTNDNMIFQAAHFGSYWGRNRLVTFHGVLLLTKSNFYFEWIFLCIGMISYIIKTVRVFRERRLGPWIIPFLFFLVNYLLILLFMKINWSRYYLPTVIASKLIVAAGIYETVIFFQQRLLGYKSLRLKDGKVLFRRNKGVS